MRKFIVISCLSMVFLNRPALAQEAPKEDKPVEPVSKAEFLQAQHALYNSADKNFDGRVNKDEITQLKFDSNKPTYVEAFNALDVNKNGYVSLEEVTTKHDEFTASRVDRQLKQKQTLLDRYDKDENGVITSRELDVYFEKEAEKLEAKTPDNAKRDFQNKDKDESGSVTLKEYLESKKNSNGIRISRASNGSKTRPSVFKRDENGDKIITRLENEKFATDVFLRLDKNKDEELSVYEQSNRGYQSSKTMSLRWIYIR